MQHADPARDPGGAAVVRGLRRRRRPRQRPVQDEADDLAGGRPRLLRLDGHRPPGARTDQLLPLRGHVQDVHRDLPDHGERPADPLQRRLLPVAARRLAGGLPAPPALPAALGCRTHGLARLFDVLGGALCKQAPELNTAAGYGTSPVHALLGLGRQRASSSTRWRSSTAASQGGRIGDGMDGHSWWPLFENIPTEYLEAYYPLRIDGYTTIEDSDGLDFHRGGNGVEKRYVYLEPGRDLHPRRPLADPGPGASSAAGPARARRSCSSAPTEPRRCCPSKCDRVEVQPGDMLVYKHGRRRRLEGPARPPRRGRRARRLLRPRLRRVRARKATASIVGDAAATEAERARQRQERGDRARRSTSARRSRN